MTTTTTALPIDDLYAAINRVWVPDSADLSRCYPDLSSRLNVALRVGGVGACRREARRMVRPGLPRSVTLALAEVASVCRRLLS